MARNRNTVGTKPITVSITPQVHAALERLTQTGFSGKNAAETAGEMIRRGLESVSGGDNLVAASLRRNPKKK
jgi:hypothetical protein